MNPAKKEYFLFLSPSAPDQVVWGERPAYGEAVVVGQGPLNEATVLRGEKVVVLVPASAVLLTEVAVPGKHGRIIKKSIPYALEESLAEDIDNLHFAHGPIGKTGEIPVVVVARAQMESWLASLLEHGIEARSIVPATLAIPLDSQQWTVVLADSQFMLRKDAWHAYAGDIGSLPVFLEGELTLRPEQTPVVQLFVDNACAINPAEVLGGLPIVASHKKSLPQLLVEGYDEKTVINLLQGDYSRHAGWRDFWAKWQLPLVAGGILFFLTTVGFAFDYYRLSTANTELTNRITGIYLQSFPGSRRVVNARAQMEQKLAELQQDAGMQSSFFDVYDKAAPLLLASAGFSLNNLRFNNGIFDFDFEIKDLESLETFKHNVANIPGLAIEIKHAEAIGSRVKAKIQIKSRL